jgi:hypothetical protein
MLTSMTDCYGWGTLGDFKMPQDLRAIAAPYQVIGSLLADVVARDFVRREERLMLYDAVEALAGASEADVTLAWRVTRAVHAFEFAMIHSAAPDRIYARKALKRAQASWAKQVPASRAGAWEAPPHELAA